MGGSDIGDLGSAAAILLRKSGTTVMGIFWQISASAKEHLLIQNYGAIYHLLNNSKSGINQTH